MRKLLPFLAMLSILAFACTSIPPSKERVPTLPEARVKGIRTMVDSGSFLPALQEISYFRREKPDQVSAEDLDSFESQALDALRKAFDKAVTENKLREAIVLFRSAAVYARPELLKGWTEKALWEKLASNLDSSSNRLLSLLARIRAVSTGESTQAELEDAYSYASRTGNLAAAQSLAELMKKRGFPAPEAAVRAGGMDYQRMIKGTVTMWVNKGIKIKGGVGYPDRSLGSGFFIDPRGYLLTNYHVINSEVDPKYEGYSRLFIRLADNPNDKIPAKVVGYDTVFDLALVKVELTPDYVFSGLSTEAVGPGDKIYAVGSPGGLEKTITAGIVSATERRLLQMGDVFQIDAPLNPGNSGGPLLNEKGDVIGIGFAGIEQFQNINFAVPYYWIEKVLPQLYAGGKARHPWLGMALSETDKGLEVIYTVPDEPADKAGIQVGDILQEIGGAKYRTLRDVQDALLESAPPSLVRVAYSRAGVRHENVLCVSERPDNPIETALKRDSVDGLIYPLFGLQLEKMGKNLFSNEYVVRRVAKGSVADETGFSENDPLTIQDWRVDKERGLVYMQVFVKKRRQGFLESIIQIGAYMETDNFV